MASVEELSKFIAEKGEEIRALKEAKPPTLKDDLKPLIAELLSLKASYKELSGEEFGGGEKKPEKKNIVTPEPQKDGPSKKDLNKEKRKAEKAAKKAESRAEKTDAPTPITSSSTENTTPAASEDLTFGDLPLIRSATLTDKIYVAINEIDSEKVGQSVWIRGRIATSRAVGKGCFLVIRQTIHSIQGVLFQGGDISKVMVKYASSIPSESVIDVYAQVTAPEIAVQGTTIKQFELKVQRIHTVSKSAELPFLVDDAGRGEAEAAATQLPVVNQDTALTYRWIDTRTPANQAIFRIQSGVCQLFRGFLLERGFIEIHTPKLIGGASEGGSSVFTLKYFDQPACLAQSPQLYKQIVAACGGFEKVFEIGPVFRAENSNTHRHLCEFTGLDFEMAITEHYYEVLELMSSLFLHIFDGIADKFSHELMLVSQQYPFEPIQTIRPSLRITFKEGIDMLRAAGVEAAYDEDISTTNERTLGQLVKEQYGTDFYMMDKYPLCVRPFYTMPDPENPKLSNSYDLFIRGEEIVSGAQRVHDVDLLISRAQEMNIPVNSIQSYVDAFKHGAHPHAGGGIGMERVVMLYLGLKNIRKSSMFPRDPSRLTP
mmetsp:Transcript_40528/g.41361  ORF Transcript_40528/g.41361 Transcript_40528/m.41361 type:complete len:600 (+) Transcript_40528:106-1905(+)|eukprot:CAMPEP_0182417470 /NCGR_PEP_ID=MMETSP1167-20130531/1960_1 /TAXON_ID=2988 /ORGANISM="Mallomonas Sp, Strain CCMP3275" /LENGTH=599 /DNA_ID=CAMNT_0024591079 /DNA_START=64 /DNA_END=1863 /DNA_ORIENTATION=+